MDVPGLKAWIEDLCSKNKILENENGTLKEQNQSLTLENKRLKMEVDALKNLPKTPPASSTSESGSDDTESDEDHKKARELAVERSEISMANYNSQRTLKINKYVKMHQTSLERLREVWKEDEQKTYETFPRINPMLIEEVVLILMGFVQTRDLASCRRVCKLWKHEASKQIQERHVFNLSFFYNDKIKDFLDHAAISFPNFRKLHVNLKGSDGPPNSFNNLFMTHGKSLHDVQVQFGYEQNLSMDNFRDLFLASLEQIKTLKIEGLRCLLIHEPRIFGPNHTRKILPHLTSLNIEMIHPCIVNHGDTQVFIDLLRIAPNLTTLHWKSKPHNDLMNNGTRTMLESLLEVNPPKLQSLFLHSPISPTLINLLASCSLKLTKLYFTELEGFEVHFSSGVETQTNILPKRVCYSQIPAMELKQYLENQLAGWCGGVYCTTLLKTFLSALAGKLAQV